MTIDRSPLDMNYFDPVLYRYVRIPPPPANRHVQTRTKAISPTNVSVSRPEILLNYPHARLSSHGSVCRHICPFVAMSFPGRQNAKITSLTYDRIRRWQQCAMFQSVLHFVSWYYSGGKYPHPTHVIYYYKR